MYLRAGGARVETGMSWQTRRLQEEQPWAVMKSVTASQPTSLQSFVQVRVMILQMPGSAMIQILPQ